MREKERIICVFLTLVLLGISFTQTVTLADGQRFTRTINGWAEYDGNGWAVGANVTVFTDNESVDEEDRYQYDIVDNNGFWQVDVGPGFGGSGPDWPPGSDFEVIINSTNASYPGWQGFANGTTPETGGDTNVGTVILYAPNPTLAYNPTSHDFGDVDEDETYDTTFDIWNSGSGMLTWSLNPSDSWLSVIPSSGSSTGEHDIVTVTIDTTGLTCGFHNGEVIITSNDKSGLFNVSFNINCVPNAVDDTASTDEDTSININVTANDDFGGDGPGNFPINILSGPSHGNAIVNDEGTSSDPTDDSIDYTPDNGWSGSDYLVYEIEDIDGDTDTATVTINIGSPPLANYTYSPVLPNVGQTISFTDTSSDTDKSIDNWFWDFGDGNTTTIQNPSHSYSNSGRYHVTLTVNDDDGESDSHAKLIPVGLDLMHLQNVSDGWNLVSVPFNQSIVKDDLLVKHDGYFYSLSDGLVSEFLFGWDRAGQYYTFADTLVPGYGYWLYSHVDCELWIESLTPDYDEYITTIESNWNLVSVPFDQPVDKVDLLVDDETWTYAVNEGWISDFVFGWNRAGQYYDFADTFIPGQAYWLYSYQQCVLKRNM